MKKTEDKHIKYTVRSALYTDSLHALAREPSYACAMFYAIAKMPNNFVTSPVLLRRPTFVHSPMALPM